MIESASMCGPEEEVAGPQVAAEAHLPQAPRTWSCGELIGAGAFGRVYLGLNNDNGELVAVKQVGTPPPSLLGALQIFQDFSEGLAGEKDN